jgi:hypothetical protein
MSCGGEEDRTSEEKPIIVESSIPGMYFEVPKDALPEGVKPTDLEITPIQLPIDQTNIKNGVEMQAWKLTPEGARFEKPIRLIIPFEQSIPVILHQYSDETEWVSGVHYKMSTAGNTASVPLNHFSVIVSSVGGAIPFEISGHAADTLIEEPIDAQLVFRINNNQYDMPFGVPGTNGFWISRYLVLPHGREACPEEAGGCSVFTYSENIGLGDISSNMEPNPRIFDDQFTLQNDDAYVCVEAGQGDLEITVPVYYLTDNYYCPEGRQCTKRSVHSSYQELAVFFVEIPVNCVEEKMDIEVLGFEQKASTDVMSMEASTNSINQDGQVEEYSWDVVSDDGVLVSTSTQDYVETSQGSQRMPYHNISLKQEASLPVGASALAAITTQTQTSALNFSVEGEIVLDTDGMSGMDPKQWAVSGRSTAEWSMTVSIQDSSVVNIENCELFDQLSLASFPEFQKEAGNCSFKVAGTSKFAMPSVPGLPEVSIDQDSVHIDEMNEEAKRLLESLSGQVVIFQLSVDHTEEASFSPSGQSIRKESFSVRIQPSEGG